MATENNLEEIIGSAWHPDIARFSMERWLELYEREQCPENLELLAKLFGASWYFTRFVFFYSSKIKDIFDQPPLPDFTVEELQQAFRQRLTGNAEEEQLEALKIAKNEVMLKIFLARLAEVYSQEQVELALSRLAEASFLCMVDILLDADSEVCRNMTILAMGRMAGREMNFGSDLDLIFLYKANDRQQIDLEILSRYTRKLLRNINIPSSSGILYEIDTRLRPHGNTGALISSEAAFVDYHQQQREIWERQAMLHCRPIFVGSNALQSVMEHIQTSIYQDFDGNVLRAEMIKMRQLIVDESAKKITVTGSDCKRSPGGIMDIDFIASYLQLLHGSNNPLLRTASTRQALRNLIKAGAIEQQIGAQLLQAYDYLKCVEGHLRVFDMRPTNILPAKLDRVFGLARSMGYTNSDDTANKEQFYIKYSNLLNRVRNIYNYVFELR